jgi:hypothetical protein
MADEKVVELLQQMVMQMEGQQQALVSLTAVLDKYLSVPVKVDANNSAVSFSEGSAVIVNNKPTVAAEQAGAWTITANHAFQNWEFKILLGPKVPSLGTFPESKEVSDFEASINKLGNVGWEVVNITGYPQTMATFKRPK